jgi:hypothetical protein
LKTQFELNYCQAPQSRLQIVSRSGFRKFSI